jgi:hypothetical protein
MIKCPYCGRENVAEAVRCFECGTSLVPEAAKPELPEPQIPISFRAKLRWWAIAWAATATIMTVSAPNCWTFFWLFPVFFPFGFFLLGVFGLDDTRLIILGWLYYVVLSVWGLSAKHRHVFFWIFTFLCISLLLNCVGCHAILHMKLRC